MAELSADDVEAYCGLSADADETQRMLDAALLAARREVGWHVSPVIENATMTLTGRGGHRLRLPTQKVVELVTVTDDGVALDLDNGDVVVVPQNDYNRGQEILVRHHGHWGHHTAGIVIELDHGYTEDEAADWRQAILAMVADMASEATAGRADSELASKQVHDVVYRWEPTTVSLAAQSSLTGVQPILHRYQVLFGCV